jgi:hypothetical protein
MNTVCDILHTVDSPDIQRYESHRCVCVFVIQTVYVVQLLWLLVSDIQDSCMYYNPETKVENQRCRQNTKNAPHKQCSCKSNWTTTLCYASPCHIWRTPASDLLHVLKTTVHSPTGCDYCHLWLLPRTPCSFCPLEHKIGHDKLMSTDQCKETTTE